MAPIPRATAPAPPAPGVEFINHRPYYIKAEAGSYPCQAYPAKNTRAVDRCPRWDLWEKL